MRANVGRTDAAVRGLVALGFLGLAITMYDQPLASLGSVIVALAVAATAIVHSCPVYAIFGISTGRDKHVHRPARR